jgi:hypothetical protein
MQRSQLVVTFLYHEKIGNTYFEDREKDNIEWEGTTSSGPKQKDIAISEMLLCPRLQD